MANAPRPPRIVPGIYSILQPSGGIPDGTERLTSIQKGMLALGLETPLKRGIFAGAVASAAVWAFQPSVSFTSSGSARGLEDGGVPWWTFPAGAIVLIYLFA